MFYRMSEPPLKSEIFNSNNATISLQNIKQFPETKFDSEVDEKNPLFGLSDKADPLTRKNSEVDEKNSQFGLSDKVDPLTRKDFCRSEEEKCKLFHFILSNGKKKRKNLKTKSFSFYLKERKALKTIFILVVGFILCWCPFFVLYFFQSVCPPEKCQISSTVEAIFLWLGYSNSILNPIIYAMFNRNFRRFFSNFVTCGCFKPFFKRRANLRVSLRSYKTRPRLKNFNSL